MGPLDSYYRYMGGNLMKWRSTKKRRKKKKKACMNSSIEAETRV